jgi:hypothetical protein
MRPRDQELQSEHDNVSHFPSSQNYEDSSDLLSQTSLLVVMAIEKPTNHSKIGHKVSFYQLQWAVVVHMGKYHVFFLGCSI